MEFSGKVVLVTGAAVGHKKGGPSIGSAIAFAFAKQGAKVAVLDILDQGAITAEHINKNKGKAIFIKANVSSTTEVINAIKIVEKTFGRLDCLVNCAASYKGKIHNNVVNTPEEDWKNVIDVNLNGYFRLAKHAIPLMLKNGGGTIVNISSMSAFKATNEFAVYDVTKAAINGLTRSLAADFAPKIRANAVCPGFVRIENSENNRSPAELKAWLDGIAKGYPLQRVCTVNEVANVVLFLASDKSSYINGQCIVVDGGRSVVSQHTF